MLKSACAVLFLAACCAAQTADPQITPTIDQQTADTQPTSAADAQLAGTAASTQDTDVSRAWQAMGISPEIAASTTSVARGRLTLVGDNPLSGAITFKTSGTEKVRSEFESPDGTVVRIVNAGSGTIQFPGKPPRRLSPKNTLFGGIRHLPALSRVLNATAVARSADLKAPLLAEAAFRNPGSAQTDAALIEVTKQRFEIDPTTGYVTKLSYTAFGDDDHMTRSRTEIVYSDYRFVQGVAVPFRQQRYVEGVLREEIALDSVEFNAVIADSDFVLPEVK